MSRVFPCSIFVGLAAACAGTTEPVRESGEVAGDTCSSVAPSLDPAAVTRMEQASNVLEFEKVWRVEHPGTAPGTISGSEVRERIRARSEDIRGCYDRALDKLPSGKGRVVVRFIVGADGSVPAVTITSNDFQAPEVGCCVAKGVAQWQFPDPTNGDFVVVEYPFVVRTSN